MSRRRRPVVLAIVQARMGSDRLPGKVMELIGDRPMLRCVVERVEAADGIDQIVVATSGADEDAAIAAYAKLVLELPCVAHGEPRDVLGRFAEVERRFRPEVILRITADCPLLDPRLVTSVIETYWRGCDYASNVWPRTYPDGLDVEVMSSALLRKLHRRAQSADEREHVTLRLFRHLHEAGAIRSVKADHDLSALRWTVDTAADLEFVRSVYRWFSPKTLFSWTDVLAYAPAAARIA